MASTCQAFSFCRRRKPEKEPAEGQLPIEAVGKRLQHTEVLACLLDNLNANDSATVVFVRLSFQPMPVTATHHELWP